MDDYTITIKIKADSMETAKALASAIDTHLIDAPEYFAVHPTIIVTTTKDQP